MKTITLRTRITLAVVGLSVLTTTFYATNPISFSTVNQPLGVSAAPADLTATELCTQNLDIIDCMGNVSVLATIPGPLGPCLERYTAIAPLQSASATPAPFIPRDIFVTQGAQVYQIRPPDLPMLFATIPDSGCAVDRTGITFDHVGTFGYNMIVTCLGGGVWKVDGTGTPTQIGDTGMTTEGPAVVPLSFGPLGGQILVADDADSQINAIASDGTVTYDVFDWAGAEGVVVIPSAPCTYCSGGAFFQAIENFDAIYQYPPTDFTGLGGGILVTSEAGAGAVAITWDHTNQLYNMAFFDNIPGGVYQGASFVDCDVPTPTPTPTATAAATATATATAIATVTATATATARPTATATPTSTPTATPCPVFAAPTALNETNVTFSSFTANWSSVGGAAGYRLDVSTSKFFTTYVLGYQNLDVGNTTHYNLAELNANTHHYYRLRAYNGNCISPSSNVIDAKTKPH